MAKTVFAMITLLDDGSIDPGFGNRPGGGGNRPGIDNELPGNIHHPGHPDHGKPIDTGFGQGGRPHPGNRPPGSGPDHIGNQLPWSPNSPDNSLPLPPGITAPPTPPNLKEKLVVLWRLPNTTQWHGKAMDPNLEGGMPLPETPEPKA